MFASVGAIDGWAVAAGFLRVTAPTAERVEIGPGQRGADLAFELLDEAIPFNLYGDSGFFSFDPVQQARPGRNHLYCWDENGELSNFASYDAEGHDFELVEATCSSSFSEILGQ